MNAIKLASALSLLIDHRGKTPKKLGSDFQGHGVPVVSAQLVNHGRLDMSECRFVAPDVAERWMPEPLRRGDVLLTSEAPLGRVAWVKSDASLVLGQRLFALRPEPGVLDSKYLGYWLMSSQGQAALLARQTGSTVSGIRQSALREVELDLPELGVQRSVGEVLGALDDKIAANRCVESNIDSLLGAQVSSMWKTAEKVPLGEQLRLHYGKALPVSQRAEGAAMVVGSGGVVGSHNEELISGPAVIVGRKGTVGATYWIAGGSYPIDTTFWVESTGAPLAYLYYLLKSIDFVSMSSDSAVPGLNRNRAYATEVPRVSASDLETFESASSGLMRKLEASQSENRTLAATRDELLPLLMSGRISVKDAERRVEQEV